jgi:phosphoglycolate phosphatase-like HAD superfamily hydrolase
VILQSAELKTRAFADVYEGEDPRKLADIIAYVDAHGGVSRHAKFAHIERAIFQRSGAPDAVARLAAKFRARVFDAVLACDLVPGAQALLERSAPALDLHVISGTPHDELIEIVERRGLRRHFASVRGAPPGKREAFARVLAERGYTPGEVLAVGDALTEFEAATDLGLPFLAIVPERTPSRFPPGVPRVPSLEPVTALLGLA